MIDLLEPQLGEVCIVSYEGEYDEDTGRYEGEAQISFDNGASYTGSLHEGLMHGKGTYLWSHGVKYQGDFLCGEMTGQGRYEWPDGSVYSGEVRRGLRHGRGRFESSSSQVYEGEWRGGRRHGRGKMVYNKAASVWYDGYWREGLRSGCGRMVYASGNEYLGQWEGDQKQGKGVMLWRDRSETYVGSWKSNQCEGYGEHFFDGHGELTNAYQMANMYRGEFKEGLRHGLGTFFYSDGSQYSGYWSKNKKQDDKALFISADGRLSVGKYDNDRVMESYERSTTRGIRDFTSFFHLNIMDAVANVQGCIDPSSLNTFANEIKDLQGEVEEIERIVLRFDSYLKGIYRHYRDIANSDRLLRKLQREAAQKTKAFDIDEMHSIDSFLKSFRALDSRLFCMSYTLFVQLSREMNMLSSNFTLYDIQRCVFQMQQQQRAISEAMQWYHPNSPDQTTSHSLAVTADSLDDDLRSNRIKSSTTALELLTEISDPYEMPAEYGIIERDFVELLVRCFVEKARKESSNESGLSISRAIQRSLISMVTLFSPIIPI